MSVMALALVEVTCLITLSSLQPFSLIVFTSSCLSDDVTCLETPGAEPDVGAWHDTAMNSN